MQPHDNGGLDTPTRNSYFHGQLLGVHNFELETDYGIAQRRLINRLVLGCGVVCGLDVRVDDDGERVRIGPGVAIDPAGAEIVVPERSRWVRIDEETLRRAVEEAGDCRDDACVQVLLCYRECLADPADILAGDCDLPDPCAPSTLREQYRIVFRPGCAPAPDPTCHVPDVISGGHLDHEQLARWVTERRSCTRIPSDRCVLLANVAVEVGDGEDPPCRLRRVDIGVRPVLLSPVLLWQIILALVGHRGHRQEHYE